MDTVEYKNNVACVYTKSRSDWRGWLQQHHATVSSVWLIIYKKKSDIPSVYYPEAVDEALCFGWIDSKTNKRDDQSYYVFFSQRNPKSKWSLVNKLKVEKLLAEGRMADAGLAMIAVAKQTGTWTALDQASALIVPPEMEALFDRDAGAKANWDNFPPSARRGILEWIYNAKTTATKLKRINETVQLAAKNERAIQWKKKD